MKRFLWAVVVALLANGALLSSQAGKQKINAGGDGVSGSIHVAFSTHDVRIIREYYAPRYRNLPPGLQKKLARTGQLPPGWQKKLEPFPVALERELVVLQSGHRRGVIDGHAVIFDDRTHVILDATVLF
jgi:hypothetical protein